MANTIKNVGGVAKEYVLQLSNEASLVKGIKRQFSEEFAVDGVKTGNVLNVKYMDNPQITRGRQISIQPIVERTIPITILDVHQYQAAIDFGSRDYALTAEPFMEKTNMKQTVRKMINDIESDCARLALGFTNAVGTLGTTPGTAGGVGLLMTAAPQIYTNAGSVLTAAGALADERTMALSPVASGLSVSSLSGLQNPSEQISSQYRKGRMGAQTLNFDFIENVNLPAFTTGTRSQAGGVVAVQSVDGDTSLTVSGLGANATIIQGEHFTVAGVNMVNPLNQLPQGFLQSFAVTASVQATAGGVAVIPVAPTISLSNPQLMINNVMANRYPLLPVNANGTVDALPQGGATVTFSGAASTTGVFNFGIQKDAIVMTTVKLPIYDGQDKCAYAEHDGFGVRVWRNADIMGDRIISRIDTVVVFTLVRQQCGVVVWG